MQIKFKSFSLPLHLILAVACCLLLDACSASRKASSNVPPAPGTVSAEPISRKRPPVIPAAEQTEKYIPYLKSRKIALVVNQTSLVDKTHLIDTLLSSGIALKAIFAPEHGFRGDADAGEQISSTADPTTGLPVISLYGKTKKPAPADLKGIDLVVFDIQDVGARFYTFISTLHYVMEACAENGVELMILDRPNPNGFYVDGPVLKKEYTSFVGMHPVPVVHGMTIGEYAHMINGEKWLKDSLQCMLRVVRVKNYNHSRLYTLPVRPSPNLPNMQAIYLYPSLCFFEGTVISMGRGTEYPFQVLGHPSLNEAFEFTPRSIPGMSKNPPYEGQVCRGIDLRNYDTGLFMETKKLNLGWLIQLYNEFPEKDKFFNSFFEKLAGNAELRQQISSGMSEEAIRETWEQDLEAFHLKRKKYLLYR